MDYYKSNVSPLGILSKFMQVSPQIKTLTLSLSLSLSSHKKVNTNIHFDAQLILKHLWVPVSFTDKVSNN